MIADFPIEAPRRRLPSPCLARYADTTGRAVPSKPHLERCQRSSWRLRHLTPRWREVCRH